MNLEKNNDENHEGKGVQKVKIENHHFVVSVVWNDGKNSEMHFPEDGLNIYNTTTNQKLGYLSGEEAVSILKNHSHEYNMNDFSWINFV